MGSVLTGLLLVISIAVFSYWTDVARKNLATKYVELTRYTITGATITVINEKPNQYSNIIEFLATTVNTPYVSIKLTVEDGKEFNRNYLQKLDYYLENYIGTTLDLDPGKTNDLRFSSINKLLLQTVYDQISQRPGYWTLLIVYAFFTLLSVVTFVLFVCYEILRPRPLRRPKNYERY